MKRNRLLPKIIMSAVFTCATIYGSSVYAQVKVGDNPTSINPSAVLDVESTNKGFLPPRVALQGINDGTTIGSPATGLVVYNTNVNASTLKGQGLYINTGTLTLPVWGKLEASTSTTGSSVNKLIYTGPTDISKTIYAGSFEFRYRVNAGGNHIEARLINQPGNGTITMNGMVLTWGPNGGSNVATTIVAASATWTASDFATWKIVYFNNTPTTTLINLNIEQAPGIGTTQLPLPEDVNRFYRVTSTMQNNLYKSLVVEVF